MIELDASQLNRPDGVSELGVMLAFTTLLETCAEGVALFAHAVASDTEPVPLDIFHDLVATLTQNFSVLHDAICPHAHDAPMTSLTPPPAPQPGDPTLN